MSPGFDRAEFKLSTTDGRTFRLLEEVTFIRRNGDMILIPVGTETDGASTPPILWQQIPPFGAYWRAAILHDAAYRMRTRPIIGSKLECDELFLEAMELCDVSPVMRQIIYQGVVKFGEPAYLKDRIEAPSCEGNKHAPDCDAGEPHLQPGGMPEFNDRAGGNQDEDNALKG